MKKIRKKVEYLEEQLLVWTRTHSHQFLRVSVGSIYTLFGALKFFPSHSPAEQLALQTMEELTVGVLAGSPALMALAALETGVGLCLLFNYRFRLAVYSAFGHILCTFLPFFFFPEQVFDGGALSLSLVGQYILKNFVLIGALFVLYAQSVGRRHRVNQKQVEHNIMEDNLKQPVATDSLYRNKTQKRELAAASR